MFNRENFKIKNIVFTMLMLFFIWFVVQIKEIALLFFGAYVISCSLNPLVDKLSTKMNRALAATVVLISVLLGIILVLIPIIGISYREITIIISDFPAKLQSLLVYIQTHSVFGFPLTNLVKFDAVLANSTQIASEVVNQSINITVMLIEGLTIALTVSMIVFYWTYEKKSIDHSIMRIFPPKIRVRAAGIMKSIEDKVGGYIIAQALSMGTVALFTAIGLGFMRIEYSLLLGVIAGVLDIIPIVGPTVALTLGVCAALLKGPLWIIPTIIVYMVAQWVSNNLVRPLVFGKFLDLHPVLVIFSFLVAAKFLGVWGVILAPAIAAMIATLFDELYIKLINKEKDETL
ncbi:MAG: AI-2E family transporter [Candidatus Gastranaerophilales bacterium]|nr:AI-2E family transporter [Candidatus Gastranaerophilales bacterium]